MLQISDDPNLAVTRLLLLHNHGFEAEHFFSSQVRESVDLEAFGVFLICQSVGHEKAAELSARIRCQLPGARILRVRSQVPEPEPIADLTLSPPAGPWDLIRGVESLAANVRCRESSSEK